MRRIWVSLVLLCICGAAHAEAGRNCSTDRYGAPICIDESAFEESLCTALEVLSKRHDIPPAFFTRLIWQESRFNPNAVSPADAMGIAQFIASTAKIRGLTDPFNPGEALDESARYLGDLIAEFGNIGLAAIAYNGGETRAARFKAEGGALPLETENYVKIITNLTAEEWRADPEAEPDLALNGDMAFGPACLALAKERTYTKFKPVIVPRRAWGVQVAGGRSPSKARASFNRRTASCQRIIGSEKPAVFYKNSKQRGIKGYYVVRFGRDSRTSANALCTKLRRSGCLCAVYKN